MSMRGTQRRAMAGGGAFGLGMVVLQQQAGVLTASPAALVAALAAGAVSGWLAVRITTWRLSK